MILGIIVGIFVTAEFSHGTMKNSVSKGFIKWKIYIAKFISMIVASYLVILVSILVGTITGSILFGGIGDFTGEAVADIFKMVGIEVLLYTALISFFIIICMVVRNLGGVLAIIILGVLTLEPLIYRVMELISRGNIKFTNYSLLNNIALCNSTEITGSDYLRATIVALAYLTVTLALGIIAFNKSDIK
jgi:ABC-2 type transport system permease protein